MHSSTLLLPQHISYCKLDTFNLQSLLKNLIWSPDVLSTYWLSSLLQCLFFHCMEKIFFPILLILTLQREPPRLPIKPCRHMEKALPELWNIQILKHFRSETLLLRTLQEILISTNSLTGKHCHKTAFISVANRYHNTCFSCSAICLYFAGNLWESTVYHRWSQQNRYLPRRIR